MNRAVLPHHVDFAHRSDTTVIAFGDTVVMIDGATAGERLENAHRIGTLIAAEAMRAARIADAIHNVEEAIAAARTEQQ